MNPRTIATARGRRLLSLGVRARSASAPLNLPRSVEDGLLSRSLACLLPGLTGRRFKGLRESIRAQVAGPPSARRLPRLVWHLLGRPAAGALARLSIWADNRSSVAPPRAWKRELPRSSDRVGSRAAPSVPATRPRLFAQLTVRRSAGHMGQRERRTPRARARRGRLPAPLCAVWRGALGLLVAERRLVHEHVGRRGPPRSRGASHARCVAKTRRPCAPSRTCPHHLLVVTPATVSPRCHAARSPARADAQALGDPRSRVARPPSSDESLARKADADAVADRTRGDRVPSRLTYFARDRLERPHLVRQRDRTNDFRHHQHHRHQLRRSPAPRRRQTAPAAFAQRKDFSTSCTPESQGG